MISFLLSMKSQELHQDTSKKEKIINHLFGIGLGRSVFMNRFPYYNQPYHNTSTIIQEVDINYLLKLSYFLIGCKLNTQINTVIGKNIRAFNLNAGISTQLSRTFSGMVIAGGNFLWSSWIKQKYVSVILNYRPRFANHIIIGIEFQYKDAETEINFSNPKAFSLYYPIFIRSLYLNLSYIIKK